jgi:hypothetical protein
MMMRRTKKQKAKIARAFAIASAVILLFTFAVKEILKEHLKELHDSLASAESQFRIESGQLTISAQMLLAQQQAELSKIQEEKANGRLDPNRDYSALIAQDIITAQQAVAQLNSEFDSVSRLIDAMPPGAKDLRALRDQTRMSVDKVSGDVNETLKPSPDHDVYRFARIKMAMVMALVEELPVVVLGDTALSAARRIEEASEYLIRVCTRIIYVLGFLSLALGLYAAISGINSSASE